MGQSLSRRGSRISLSPRALASATGTTTGASTISTIAASSSVAPLDSVGMSDAAQRLMLLASMEANGSNKDNSDEDNNDDEEKDEDEDEEVGGQAVMRFFHQQRHERRAEVRGTSTEVEAQRQHLIENLIGMGFPIDWSLRAAEHCDANVSESVAIAWIIERMELEHEKMEEMGQGEDSRLAEDLEESDEQSGGGDDDHGAQHRVGGGHGFQQGGTHGRSPYVFGTEV